MMAACGFKLLGSPIGDRSFCCALTAKRILKNASLLQAIGDLEDPQAALLLLRSCASFGKIVFSLRTTASELHEEALRDFDDAVRACFESFSGLHPDATQWKQAGLAMHAGGLGLRGACAHAAAAHISSLSGCHSACRELDSKYEGEATISNSSFEKALREFNAIVDERDRSTPVAGKACRQKELSQALDRAHLRDLKAEAPAHMRAHLELISGEGAGAWLFAMPSEKLGLTLKANACRISLQRRLRMAIFDAEFFVRYAMT